MGGLVDIIGESFDAAIRTAVLPTLVAQRLCEIPRYLVGSPNYLNKYGRPKHPLHLAQHRCLTHTVTTEVWHFTKGAKSASVQPSGPLRVNNGDAMMPALIAGTGLGILPEFILREALAANQLERLLPDWSLPLRTVYWVTPPGEPQPKRVDVLADFLVKKLAAYGEGGTRTIPQSSSGIVPNHVPAKPGRVPNTRVWNGPGSRPGQVRNKRQGHDTSEEGG
jgi:DNA-binding transcriptional LysR family regulator